MAVCIYFYKSHCGCKFFYTSCHLIVLKTIEISSMLLCHFDHDNSQIISATSSV